VDRALLGPGSATKSACAHRLADEGATLPTSQQDITLSALLSLSFERVYLTFLCIKTIHQFMYKMLHPWANPVHKRLGPSNIPREVALSTSLSQQGAAKRNRKRRINLGPMQLHRPPLANGVRTASRGRPLATRP
jgi:hypothetical protein